MKTRIRSTTVLCVRRDGKVVMAGDGQVTFGQEVLKATAQQAAPALQRQDPGRLRRLHRRRLRACSSRFESKLEQHGGNLRARVVELAKDWRTDRALRHLEALLLVADAESTYIVSGSGDVIEPDEGVAAIGSGGPFAKAAAVALMRQHGSERPRRSPRRPWRSPARSASTRTTRVTYEELG